MYRVVTDFIAVMRELSLDEVRHEAIVTPSLLVVGEAGPGTRLARHLVGDAGGVFATVAGAVPPDGSARFDIVLPLWAGGDAAALGEAVHRARGRGWPVLVIRTSAAPPPVTAVRSEWVVAAPSDSGDLEAVRARMIDLMEESRTIALGRHVSPLRGQVARSLIDRTSRANAQFAALSNLPAMVPLIGTILGGTADMLVLTKNQLLLLYKLAAVYGRDLDDRRQIYLEMLPVVGSGLVWRTVARQLAALVPAFLGAVPKILIAYSGTYVLGRAAQYYYEEGRAPSAADLRRFRDQALAWWQAMRAGRRRALPRGVEPAAADALPRPGASDGQRAEPLVH